VEDSEIWSFCYAKQQNFPSGKGNLDYGDTWAWTAHLTPTRTSSRPRRATKRERFEYGRTAHARVCYGPASLR
jgi:hypothetical protein